jgi:hypothetical protein
VPVKASYSSVICTGVRVCPSPIPVFTRVAINYFLLQNLLIYYLHNMCYYQL